MIGGMGEGWEASGLGVLLDELETSRCVVSSFNAPGLGPRNDDGFRETTGDEADRVALPGRPFMRAPGVALMLLMPLALPVIASADGNPVWPLDFISIPFPCSCTAARPPGTLSPKPLAKGGISSSGGEAGRIGIEPGDEVRASNSAGESFSIFGVSPLIVRGDAGALLLRLAVSCSLLSWALD